jgi:hypothetical protein
MWVANLYRTNLAIQEWIESWPRLIFTQIAEVQMETDKVDSPETHCEVADVMDSEARSASERGLMPF